MTVGDVHIRPFRATDQAAARTLILQGLGDRFGHINAEMNSDLDDIAETYLACGHAFIVGEVDGVLIATGGLMEEQASKGRIVRVSVARNWRRRGIGRAIVSHLLDEARKRGFSKVVAETNIAWEDAIGFYLSLGFEEHDRDKTCVHLCLDLR